MLMIAPLGDRAEFIIRLMCATLFFGIVIALVGLRWVDSVHPPQASLRDANPSRSTIRGLKPTATFKGRSATGEARPNRKPNRSNKEAGDPDEQSFRDGLPI